MSIQSESRQEPGGTTESSTESDEHSEPGIQSFRGDESADRHARDDAISPYKFERGVQAVYRMDRDYFQLESNFIWFVAGRLGLRAGEMVHMDESWIDRGQGTLTIPKFQECHRGRDGGICGDCNQSAKQLRDNHDISLEEAQTYMWGPKTESSAREIAYDATPRTRIAVEDYFDRFDEFQASGTTIGRRVTRVCERTDCIHPDDLYPHALRATAATHLLRKDLALMKLKTHMGWSTLQTLLTYASEDYAGTAASVRLAL